MCPIPARDFLTQVLLNFCLLRYCIVVMLQFQIICNLCISQLIYLFINQIFYKEFAMKYYPHQIVFLCKKNSEKEVKSHTTSKYTQWFRIIVTSDIFSTICQQLVYDQSEKIETVSENIKPHTVL